VNDVFAIDFGTTNSIVSLVGRPTGSDDYLPRLYLQNGKPHPSVVSYSGSKPVVGQDALDQLRDLRLGVIGDIVRSPKMFLGGQQSIYLSGMTKTPVEVVRDVLSFLRVDALSYGGEDNSFSRAIITIPVTMDGRARAELREAARMAGITIHQFVHEPLSAIYGYLRQLPNYQKAMANLDRSPIVVFDWGGGTLDLTLCEMQDGVLTQILNSGTKDVGGDAFDKRLRQLALRKHSETGANADWVLLTPSSQARVLQECADAKIRLSSREATTLFVDDLVDSAGNHSTLDVRISRSEYEAQVQDLVTAGLHTLDNLLEQAGINPGILQWCIATGGMVGMPAIQRGLQNRFSVDQLPPIEKPADLIAQGAAWIAHDDVMLRLAKPLEVVVAPRYYATLIPKGEILPRGGSSNPRHFDMYCVDPSDGFAKFQFCRPTRPGREQAGDARTPYAIATLPVDPKARPLLERLHVNVDINENLLAKVSIYSKRSKLCCKVDIPDLEFGIDVAGGRGD